MAHAVGSVYQYIRQREGLVIRLSLAGVNWEAAEITFSNSADCLRRRMSELDEGEVSFYVRERYYGTFRRSMTLSACIDESSISADFKMVC